MMSAMRQYPPAYSEIAALVSELNGLAGPQRTLAMLVRLLEAIRDTGAFPRGLELTNIDETRASGEELVLIDIAMCLAAPRR
jgi:hypothetical protein